MQKEPFPFFDLPKDLSSQILGKFCRRNDLFAFLVCSRRSKTLVDECPVIWHLQLSQQNIDDEELQRLGKAHMSNWKAVAKEVFSCFQFDPKYAWQINHKLQNGGYAIEFSENNRTVLASSGLTDWLTAPTCVTLDRFQSASFRLVNYPTQENGNHSNTWKLIVGILKMDPSQMPTTSRFWIGSSVGQCLGYGIISESGKGCNPTSPSSGFEFGSNTFKNIGDVIDVVCERHENKSKIHFYVNSVKQGTQETDLDIFTKDWSFACSLSSNNLEIEAFPYVPNRTTFPPLPKPKVPKD